MTAPDDTRSKIIEAAISVLESEGEAALRVDKVMKIAGFTKPVLYHHFEDREGLIAAAQAERYRRSLEIGTRLAAEAVMSANSADEFLAAMRALLRSYAAPEGQDRRRFRIEVLGSAVSRPELMAAVIAAGRDYIDIFEMPLRLAEARGWLRPGVPIRDFSQWWVGIMLTRYLFEIDPDGFDAESWHALTERTIAVFVPDAAE